MPEELSLDCQELKELRQESERLRIACEVSRSEHVKMRQDLRDTVTALHTTVDSFQVEHRQAESVVYASGLTQREMQVLALIATSHSTKSIAHLLGVTFKTAVSHRTNIMEKLNLHDASALTRFAIRNSVISV